MRPGRKRLGPSSCEGVATRASRPAADADIKIIGILRNRIKNVGLSDIAGILLAAGD
jgi:hypothetical protein